MSDDLPRVILASKSPRRLQLLQMLGLEFDVRPADIDEAYLPGEIPAEHAQRLAREKAELVGREHPDGIVIGSDTIVVVDGDVLGKPRDEADAVAMLLRLQGREHEVATGVAVAYGDEVRSSVEHVRVRFRHLDEREVRDYVATRDPLDKAGAYGIQGVGAVLVERIEGDFFAVMGLPLARLIEMLASFGWRFDFQRLVRDGRPT